MPIFIMVFNKMGMWTLGYAEWIIIDKERIYIFFFNEGYVNVRA